MAAAGGTGGEPATLLRSLARDDRSQAQRWASRRSASTRTWWRSTTSRRSYSTVQRYVRRLEATRPLPFRRMECAPGEEAQADFGSGAPLVVDGKRRKTHVLRIKLSHSRKAYSEAVERQTTDNFIRVLENAFAHFGGVPQTLVIDNLKAAVSKADWYDPELNPKLRAFAAHYGLAILPTKPRMPRHKGKIERGVDYVQENGLRGRTFPSLEGAERVPQTLGERRGRLPHPRHDVPAGGPGVQSHRAAGLTATAGRCFPLFKEAQRTVHRDGHVSVERSYYSVPPEYLGAPRGSAGTRGLVRIFNSRLEQIAIHGRQPPGKFSTQRAHIAAEKISGVERGATWLLAKAGGIGPHAQAWAAAMLESRGVEGLRVLQGLSARAARHGSLTVDAACEVAQSYAAYRLRTIRQLLKRQEPKQVELAFLAEHPLIRDLSDYSAAGAPRHRANRSDGRGKGPAGPPGPFPSRRSSGGALPIPLPLFSVPLTVPLSIRRTHAMTPSLVTALKQLRLSGLLQSLDVRLQEAAGHQLSHAEFLELILQDELGVRNERLIQRRVKNAMFRELKPLSDFDWSFNPSIKKKQIFDLATCRFIREGRDVLLLGPPGVGKSYLAQAIGYEAIKQGLVVLYRSIFDVVRDFLHEEAVREDDKLLPQYLKPDLLIVDDMGMKQLPRRSGEVLFEIILRRYETRSTVMTSNRPLEDWGKLIGDVPSATAILDRFLSVAT